MRFSLGSGFLHINKHACKQICPVWIHAPSKPLVGVGRGVYTRFALGFVSSTLLPLHCFSCLGSRPLLSERPLGIDYYRFFPSHCCRCRRRCFKFLIHLLPSLPGNKFHTCQNISRYNECVIIAGK